jgi:enediyne biosynthesis protein E4
MVPIRIVIIGTTLFIAGCKSEKTSDTLFTKMESSETGIDFENNLTFDQNFNIYTYRNFYNGGGVAMGDIDKDGLIDVYLTANQGPNKLFRNLGNFKFEDVTEKAGVAGTKAWSTGVSMADVNGDGWLDIYVCNSGDVKGDNKENELFINNGDLTFSERAKEYGVADRGFTTHAAFFDYDRDNDLDLYILNNSYQAIGSFNLRKNERPKRDSLGGDKLLRNDGNQFVDVSEDAGIYGSVIGFGLGVTVGDIDKDGWPDIYVSNDFFERDYLYLNNHNGSFREVLTEQMKSISAASMGADLADINNDAFPDIFVTEMLPQGNERIKTVTTFDNWDRYQYNVNNDYYHQFTRNMLQLNNGNGTFSEIGRLSKVEATDWSWGALLFDMDNDGLKDIFVANGIYQDLTNLDYLQYVSNEEVIRSIITDKSVDYKSLVELIPSTPISDFAFHNEGNLQFTDKAAEWGIGEPNFSNGSAYGDLDNDGDLDLVVSNVNSQVSIIRNETNKLLPGNRFLKFELKGIGKNTAAWGTKISIEADGKIFYIEQMPNRGFESSMDQRPNLGLGAIDTVDVIRVDWPDGRMTLLEKVVTNQTIKLQQAESEEIPAVKKEVRQPIFEQVSSSGADYVHQESEFVDFDRDKLVYHMLSSEGPRISKGDVNGDGREDFFIGGAKDSPGALYVQKSNGKFEAGLQRVFREDKASEDQASLLFDADGDGDLDLYVCSGSNEFSTSSTALADRLYFNNGQGNFTKSEQILPTFNFESTSTVVAGDYDHDRDLDLFVGVRSHPFLYGVPVNGYILSNNGKGLFTDVSSTVAPALNAVGMITDASWTDIEGDNDVDLIVVGEYMEIKVFVNEGGRLEDQTEAKGLSKTNGWWRRIEPGDLDNDGDIDFVVANYGLNSRFRASPTEPITMYVNDFDKNGSVEQIVCSFVDGKSYPMPLRHDLMSQIPSLKKKYLKYESYKNQTITDIFSPAEMEKAIRLEAFELASVVLLNDGRGKFSMQRLPIEAQVTVMSAIELGDFDGDGNVDIVLGGNLYRVKPELGRYDASYGLLLRGDGKGGFKSLTSQESGISIQGEVRDIVQIKTPQSSLLVISRNNDSVVVLQKK